MVWVLLEALDVASCLLDRVGGWEAFLVKRGVACVLGRAAGLEQRRLRSHEEEFSLPSCSGVSLGSVRVSCPTR